ncbi:DUF1648 domain-containing protein [Kineococcus auxinigenes]|uniref:DUF1648 domain-containing protein n=1 Tax=unclassified Kineococcus TaxID=2621656 RepID=UPI003D7D1736
MRAKLFAGSVVLYAAAVVVAALVLPERVPTHFGGSGEADDWSSRTGAVTVSALIGAALAALFAALAAGVRRLPVDVVNVPNAWYWRAPEHEAELRRRAVGDLWAVGTATMLLLTAVEGAIVQVALTGTGRLPWWFFAVFGTWIAGLLVWALTLGPTRYRVPEGAGR